MGPASMNNKDVAQILEDIALLLEIQGENPFKARAYSNGARLLSGLDRDVAELVVSGEIRSLKGIGPALSEKITELVTSGRLEYYERLKAAVPVGLLELLQVPQLGPKKIKMVHEKLGITSLGELEYACLENRLMDLPGFGEKTQETLLKGIAQLKKNRGQFLLGDAVELAEALVDRLRGIPGVDEVSLMGSVRRRREVIRDIDCVISSARQKTVLDAICRWPDLGNPELPGEGKACGKWEGGIPVEIQVVSGTAYPFALLYGTGSSEHREELTRYASSKGFSLTSRGLSQSGIELTGRNEAEIYKALGLSWIPPELREGLGEIEAAALGGLPELVDEKDIRGVLHVHSDYSDGTVPIGEMAAAAQKLGYSYLGIADHSETARYAHGLERDRLRQQHEEIDRLNENFQGFVLLKGIELEILADGGLDYDESVWKTFDFIVASVHSRFKMNREEMTNRIVRALENPYVRILGHMTGRLLLAREPYEVDIERVLEAAARNGVSVELNANPHRLDIDWRHLRRSSSLGIPISINPDAHTPQGLKDTSFGVAMARKGWLTRAHVLNALDTEDMRRWLRRADYG